MTLQYYQNNAQLFFDGTVSVDMSSLYTAFTQYLTVGDAVLDAGCGSGRDAKAFQTMGYHVDAFDASAEMVMLARKYTGLPIKEMMFNDVVWQQKYAGIWCCASLLHLPMQQLPDVMRKLADSLKVGGVWYISFKYGDTEREHEGRHFTDINEDRLQKLLEYVPEMKIISVWKTEDKRPHRHETWLNAILRRY